MKSKMCDSFLTYLVSQFIGKSATDSSQPLWTCMDIHTILFPIHVGQSVRVQISECPNVVETTGQPTDWKSLGLLQDCHYRVVGQMFQGSTTPPISNAQVIELSLSYGGLLIHFKGPSNLLTPLSSVQKTTSLLISFCRLSTDYSWIK